jgi:hypothetical protein
MPLVVSIASLIFSFLPSLPSPTHVSYRQSREWFWRNYWRLGRVHFHCERIFHGVPVPHCAFKGSSSKAGAIAGGVGVSSNSLHCRCCGLLSTTTFMGVVQQIRHLLWIHTTHEMNEISRPISDGTAVGPSSMAPSIGISYTQGVLDDQTTFWGYAGLPSVDSLPGSTLSHVGSGSNLANMQTSLSPDQGMSWLEAPMSSVRSRHRSHSEILGRTSITIL